MRWVYHAIDSFSGPERVEVGVGGGVGVEVMVVNGESRIRGDEGSWGRGTRH
jgi:hypothetical protein